MVFAIDLFLGLLLIFTAWRAFQIAPLQRAVIWFVAFGLTLALVWLRLGVVLVAVAEASIGALLTGIIIYRVIRRTANPQLPPRQQRQPERLTPHQSQSVQRAPEQRLQPDIERSPWLSFAVSALVLLALLTMMSFNFGELLNSEVHWFATIGSLVIALALHCFFRRAHILPRLFAINLMGSGVFLIMISMARSIRVLDLVAEVLVLTGILISLGATSLALHIFIRYYQSSRSLTLSITATQNKRRS